MRRRLREDLGQRRNLLRLVPFVLACGLFDAAVGTSAEVDRPRVSDPRLKLSLLAREPEIVTPVALAADRQGRLLVAETHTHARSSQYEGPPGDRLLLYEDLNGDGQLERSRVYADGLENVLSIAFASDETLYVLQMKSLLVLRDQDGDGQLETEETLVTIETDNNNHHGVFLALAFDNQDRAYITLGNIGGNAYTIHGTDDAEISGQGDTGLIVRCNRDGTGLERFAHGFWNPCDLKFDSYGRLLATDNDPDSRGPNRVLHVVNGGRYGYQSRFGPSGLHPFDAWNGELPGTLPMLAGVGEAPVGVFDCNASSLPKDYGGDLLVAVWGTNEVVRVKAQSKGVSLSGRSEPLIVGGRGFRPTGITATTDGTVYIADWADRRYPVHGKGRIWRLSAMDSHPDQLTPQTAFSNSDRRESTSLPQGLDVDPSLPMDVLLKRTADSDPFVAATAVSTLSHDNYRESLINELEGDSGSHRLACLLALREAYLPAKLLERLIRDEDPRIRQAAMIHLGESMRLDLADALRGTMTLQTGSTELFETFLATTQLLTEREAEHVRKKTPGTRIDRKVNQNLILEVLEDESQPADSRAMALAYLDDSVTPRKLTAVANAARSHQGELAREAIRTLAGLDSDETQSVLWEIAQAADRPADVRCDAIAAMGSGSAPDLQSIARALADSDQRISLAAARALTGHVQQGDVRLAMEHALPSLSPEATEQVRFALKTKSDSARPKTDAQWAARMDGGDAEAGRRVFFDSRLSCAKCHRFNGRGGRVGPDLTNISKAKTSEQILTSILHPSQDRSPDYQGYVVLMQDGQLHRGTQFHFRGESADLLTLDGKWIRFALEDTEDYRPLDTSLMPEDLVDLMSVTELRDLMRFLSGS